MSASARLAVVVVNYASSSLLTRHLAAVAASTEAGVIVVDNFSGEEERRRVALLASRNGWHLVAPADNRGFGAGMNVGVAEAIARGYDAFLLLNPDAFIDGPQVEVLAEHVLAHPDGAVAPTVLRPDGGIYFAGSDLHLRDGRIRSRRRRSDEDEVQPWLTGACLAISRSLWKRVGGFDESYFLYWEDVDLSWRIVACGGTLAVLDEVTATHDEGGTHRDETTRPEAKSTTYYYYNIRNRLLFARRNLGTDAVKRWRRNDLRIAAEILLQGGRRQFLSPMPALTAAYRGVRDGRRLASSASIPVGQAAR